MSTNQSWNRAGVADAASASGAGRGPYLVLARKYRPSRFDDLIGQDAMVRTLKNAFRLGRIAQAYMLTGVRGVGKTTTARILARALNYAPRGLAQGAPDPGPSIDLREPGEHCQQIVEGRHVDVVEMDAASHTGIEDIREVIEQVRYKPACARFKVFIIDEVHMLSRAAFNGLLKTLEEPPEHAKFIFATTEIRKVPVTVLSRCQRFDLRRIDAVLLAQHYGRIAQAEGQQIEEEALALIARAAEGSARDGLSILDQAFAHGQGTVTAADVRAMLGLSSRSRIFDLLEAVFKGDAAAGLRQLDGLYEDGADPGQTLGDLAEAVHAVTRMKVAGLPDPSWSETERGRASDLAARMSLAALSRAWQMLLKGLDETARAPRALAAAEMVLIRMCYAASLPPPDAVIRNLTAGAGAGVLPAHAERATNAERPAAAPAAVRLPAQGAATRSDVTAPVMAPVMAPVPAPPAPAPAEPVRQSPPPGPARRPEPPALPPRMASPAHDDGAPPATEDSYGADWTEAEAAEPDDGAPPEADIAPVGFARIESFADAVRVAAEKRDVRLKIALEESVELVRFRPGQIELRLLKDAPPGLAGDVKRRLEQWTGERWVVSVSEAPGEKTLGAQRREREAQMRQEIRRHPEVLSVLQLFPQAEITAVRELAPPGAPAAPGGGAATRKGGES